MSQIDSEGSYLKLEKLLANIKAEHFFLRSPILRSLAMCLQASLGGTIELPAARVIKASALMTHSQGVRVSNRLLKHEISLSKCLFPSSLKSTSATTTALTRKTSSWS